MKRILIAAGGTGGHFYPGISLVKGLRQKGWEAVFIVRKEDPARKSLEANGFPYVEIPLRGMPRRLGLAWWPFFMGITASLRLTLNIVSDFKPNIIVGMGGYLSFPAILAAALKRKPRLVHESNVLLGFSNRICMALGAKLIRGLPGEKGILMGTPIRSSLWKILDATESKIALGFDPRIPMLLIFGGSQGARGMNLQVPVILKTISTQFPHRFQVLHLSGKDSESVAKAYKDAPFKVEVKSYFDSMESAYGAADLVLCRAGASTIAELCAQKKPAILVPFPGATANHQFENAQVLEKTGAAIILTEETLSNRLSEMIEKLILSDGEKLRKMKAAYQHISLPNPEQAERNFVEFVEKISKNSSARLTGS